MVLCPYMEFLCFWLCSCLASVPLAVDRLLSSHLLSLCYFLAPTLGCSLPSASFWFPVSVLLRLFLVLLGNIYCCVCLLKCCACQSASCLLSYLFVCRSSLPCSLCYAFFIYLFIAEPLGSGSLHQDGLCSTSDLC
ncbi:hypothetical protein K438DRAFT_2096627 [Mycena galopus ATCC 62051]|nr:hypothetical protein K438DRAFT_2096627 [Mycena galopus ATCC 62051]